MKWNSKAPSRETQYRRHPSPDIDDKSHPLTHSPSHPLTLSRAAALTAALLAASTACLSRPQQSAPQSAAETSVSARTLTGEAALGDWTTDAPGVRRRITVADLPPPNATASVD